MKAFYGETEILNYQIGKLTDPGARYAERAAAEYERIKKSVTAVDN